MNSRYGQMEKAIDSVAINYGPVVGVVNYESDPSGYGHPANGPQEKYSKKLVYSHNQAHSATSAKTNRSHNHLNSLPSSRDLIPLRSLFLQLSPEKLSSSEASLVAAGAYSFPVWQMPVSVAPALFVDTK